MTTGHQRGTPLLEPTDVIGGDCRLFNADCLAVLRGMPDASVGAVITDPPYGTGGWRREAPGQGSSPAAKLVREDWDSGDLGWLSHAARLAPVVMTFWPPARTSLLLAAADRAGLTKHRALYWHKPDPKPQVAGRVAWSVEPIWVLTRDGVQLYGETDWITASTPRLNRDDEAVGHPYQKPLRVLRWLLRKLPAAAAILDPFMGSGTTIAAAMREGRKAVGIELDPTHYATALRRLRHATGGGPGQLFSDAEATA